MLGSRVRSPGGSLERLQNTFWSLFFCAHFGHTSQFLRECFSGNLLRVHKNAPIRGQMPPAGTIHPHQTPSVWTKVISRTKLPQKAPSVWTGGNYFSSASTKTPPSVDKCHLRAPYIHTRHSQRGQKSSPAPNFHKKHLLCGQAATISPPRPQKIPELWTKPYS